MSEHPPPQEMSWPDGAIFTLGHSTLPIERFIAVLRAYDIERLVDIRTVPRSRYNPQFNDSVLAKRLTAEHLEYVHMPALGGLRRVPWSPSRQRLRTIRPNAGNLRLVTGSISWPSIRRA